MYLLSLKKHPGFKSGPRNKMLSKQFRIWINKTYKFYTEFGSALECSSWFSYDNIHTVY
jgi:hypothetical protein